QQIPAEYTMLTGDFFFANSTAPRSDKEPVKEAPKTIEAPLDISTTNSNLGPDEFSKWEAIKNSTSSADYQRYLKDYPDGLFSRVAQDRLQQLALMPTAAGTSVGFRVRSAEKTGKIFLLYRVLFRPPSTTPVNANDFMNPLM